MVQFRSLNIRINYKIQLPMINMPLKGHHISKYIKKINFDYDVTWFLACCFTFLPFNRTTPLPTCLEKFNVTTPILYHIHKYENWLVSLLFCLPTVRSLFIKSYVHLHNLCPLQGFNVFTSWIFTHCKTRNENDANWQSSYLLPIYNGSN